MISQLLGRNFWSLRTRMFWLVLLISSLSLMALSIASYTAARATIVTQAQTQATIVTEQIASSISQEVSPLNTMLRSVAISQLYPITGTIRLAQLETVLPAELQQQPNVLGIYTMFEANAIDERQFLYRWYTRDGSTITRAYGNLPGDPNFDPQQPVVDYHTMEWYTSAKAAPDVYWTQPYHDPVVGIPLVTAAVSFVSEGRVIGVGGLDMSLSQVQTIIDTSHPTPNSYLILTSNTGSIVAASKIISATIDNTFSDVAQARGSADLIRLSEAMRGNQSGQSDIIDPYSSTPAWALYRPIPQSNWSIAVVLPQQDLLGGLDMLRNRAILLSLVALLIQALCVYFLARSIVRPLQQVTIAAKRMSDGDLTQPITISSMDEIGVLGTTLNQLAQAVQQRTQDLTEQFRLRSLAEAHAAELQAEQQQATIEEQARLIREMDVPILALSKTTLMMSLIGTFTPARLQLMQEQILQRLERAGARWLILDVTGVTMIDAPAAMGLIQVVQACRLLGAHVYIAGVRPEIAETVVALGLDLAQLSVSRDLQSAIASVLK